MKIHGIQKMTLLDYPGRVACTVFLAGCDFRCPFCHNSELIGGEAEPVMGEDEFFSFLNKRKGLLDGVAVTGGEPMLRADLPEFFRKIKSLGYPVKCDTNGNHPEMLKTLIDEGLVDYVAMDIKNSPERYGETAGLTAFATAKVEESINILLAGNVDYEFRTTVVDELHDEESFKKIGPWIKGAKRYFLQPFKDRDSVVFSGLTAPSHEKLERYKNIMTEYVGEVSVRGEENV